MSGEDIADLSFIPSVPEFSYHFNHKIFLQMSAESQIAALGIVLPAVDPGTYAAPSLFSNLYLRKRISQES